MPIQKRALQQLVPYAILVAVLWSLLSGHTEWYIVLLGVLSVALVCALAVRMGLIDEEGFPLFLVPRAAGYWPWLFGEIVKSNFDVARRVLHPALPIDPVEVDIPATQATDVGRVTFANSITLTPGTVAMGVGDGTIRVHALSAAAARNLANGEMDRRVGAMERGR